MSNAASTITIIITVSGVTIGAVYAMAAQLGKRIDDLRDSIGSRLDTLSGEIRELRGDVSSLERTIVREHGERITRLEERL